jgi:two-component system, NarL family, nitrate/nitrite response regulator NarL
MRTCLICDDHALVREALAGTVRMGWPGIEILEASDFPSAWSRATTAPELIIADLVMPGAGPKAGIAGLLAAAPTSKLLVVTGTQDDALLLDLLDMGVAGFAPKTSNGSLIEAAIRLILAGGRYLPPRIGDIAAARAESGGVPMQRDRGVAVAERLTDRQLDVLRLLAKGHSNKEIGRVLDLAPSTVKTHITHVFSVLGAVNRTDASIKAQQLDLV